MSFDGSNTVASTYFDFLYGLFDGAASLTKYLIEQKCLNRLPLVHLIIKEEFYEK